MDVSTPLQQAGAVVIFMASVTIIPAIAIWIVAQAHAIETEKKPESKK